MREYGQIQCSFWGSPEIAGLDSNGKLLAAYLLTGPHSNGLGCFRVPLGYVMADLGWDKKTVSKGFEDLIDSGFCLRCNDTEWVIMPKYLKWNPIANPKVGAARVKEARACPTVASIWPAMVEAIDIYAGKHLPKDFRDIITEKWKPIACKIPEKTRQYVLDRGGNQCSECGAKDDITIDHIRPVAYGGTHDESNLRVLCRSCNSKWFPNGIETLSKQDPTLPYPTQTQPREENTLGKVDRFQDFWDAFADKRGKDGAERVWKRRKLDEIADYVIEGASQYAATRGTERKYWKQAQGWLNDGRWQDDLSHKTQQQQNDDDAFNAWFYGTEDAAPIEGELEHE